MRWEQQWTDGVETCINFKIKRNALSPRERDSEHQSVHSQVKQNTVCFLHRSPPAAMKLGGRCFEEKGNEVGRLAPPGPATGINSRMEAGAAVTPAQRGIHFSLSSRVPARSISLAADARPSVITWVS